MEARFLAKVLRAPEELGELRRERDSEMYAMLEGEWSGAPGVFCAVRECEERKGLMVCAGCGKVPGRRTPYYCGFGESLFFWVALNSSRLGSRS